MKGKEETLALLGRTELFSGLPSGDLEALLADVRTRRFAAGFYILREGDAGDHLHVIASGEVRIARTTEAGGEVVFGVLGTGDVFGEFALLEEGGLRGADAQALTETECLLLHRRAFVAFLQTHPEIMWRVVTQLIGRIRRKDEEFADLAFHDTQIRCDAPDYALGQTEGRLWQSLPTGRASLMSIQPQKDAGGLAIL